MTSAPASPSSVEATTTLLQAELPRLEAHQQSLEKELAAVTERLESVRSALTALQALSGVPHVLRGSDEAQETEEVTPAVAEPVAEQVVSVPAPRRSSTKKTAAKKRAAVKKPARAAKPAVAKQAAAKKSEESADDKGGASGLTRQVLDILADAKGGTVRARDVAKVLGRDGSPGDINAVRSTLDRLVATSRADRAGRGLYRERV